MTRRSFLEALLAGTGMLAIPALAQQTAPRPGVKRPNIVFIMSDDQGPWAWGGGGHPNARTPNLDRLRREGALLSNHFVACPVCSPSRASLISSRYPTEHGITDYLGSSAPEGLGLDPNLPTWPRLLQQGGYHTGLIGKWHLGYEDRYLPKYFGYDEFAGWREGAKVSKDPKIEVDGQEQQLKGFTTDLLTDRALDFIEKHKEEPFLLSLHFFAPHANGNKNAEGDRTWLPLGEEDWAPFESLDPTLPEPPYPKLDVPRAKRMTREYFASIAGVDRNVGRVLEALERLGLADNTIVVFTSDNGYNMAHHGIWHKGNGFWLLSDNQGQRPNLWDNSIKTPAIVRWPAGLKPGTSVEHSITNMDWFPTLLAMAGVELPDGTLIRGRNFLPLLQGKDISWDDDFFVQYDEWKPIKESANLRGYRTRDWKLVRDFRNAGKDELFNLRADPKELTNLLDSTDPAAQAARSELETKLREAMARIKDTAYLAVGSTAP